MFTTDVVAGVHRVEHAATSCYLVEDGSGGLVLVDGGLPRTWVHVDRLLARLGSDWDDVGAIVLTHAHFDHLGVCAAAESRGIRTWVHVGDEPIARRPYRYRPGRPRLLYPLGFPRSLPHLAAMTAAGALRVRGVREPHVFDDSTTELPGGLVVVPTPGHTDGHVALHLPEHDVVLTGDALVTLDPYTGRRGPRVVARAGTNDRERALRSLDAIAATGAGTVLPGHGEPFTEGAGTAAAKARLAGAA